MLGWINGLLGWGISGIEDLWNKVVSVFQNVVNWVTDLINQAFNDINTVAGWAWNTIQSVEQWAMSMYNAITSWATSMFQSIVAWTSNLISHIEKSIQDIMTWTAGWINRIYSDVESWLRSLETWVITNIWNPLYGAVTGIIRWVNTYGVWMLYLLTHPEALATLLGQYLLGAWMGISRKFAAPLGRWMLHSLLSISGDIAGMLEDFLSGIL